MSWKKILKQDEISRMKDSLNANMDLLNDYFKKMEELMGSLESQQIEKAEKLWTDMQDMVKDVEGLGLHKNIHAYLNRIILD
tara:strand:+ start:703 stop:948 length:246 start_codon:yes stop_codon:yes gene_type:complete